MIVFPIYPKAPNNTYQSSIKIMDELYNLIMNKTNKDIVFMGDSSGGGLTLAYNEFLSINKFKQPCKTILISPWLDVSLSHKDIKKYERKDPMLSINPLITIGKLWSGNTDNKYFLVSPFYGDVKNISNLTLIVGDREILYPKIVDFSKKLTKENTNHNLYIKKGMNHAFPLFPINEAKEAKNYIFSIINGK